MKMRKIDQNMARSGILINVKVIPFWEHAQSNGLTEEKLEHGFQPVF